MENNPIEATVYVAKLTAENATLIEQNNKLREFIQSVIDTREQLTDYPTWADEISAAGETILNETE